MTEGEGVIFTLKLRDVIYGRLQVSSYYRYRICNCKVYACMSDRYRYRYWIY